MRKSKIDVSHIIENAIFTYSLWRDCELTTLNKVFSSQSHWSVYAHLHRSITITTSFPTLIRSLTHICQERPVFLALFQSHLSWTSTHLLFFSVFCLSFWPDVQVCVCVMVNNCLQPFWIENSLIETCFCVVIKGHESRTPFLASCQYCIYMYVCNSVASAKTVWSQSVPPYRCLTLSPGPRCRFIDLQLAHSTLNYEHIEQARECTATNTHTHSHIEIFACFTLMSYALQARITVRFVGTLWRNDSV